MLVLNGITVESGLSNSCLEARLQLMHQAVANLKARDWKLPWEMPRAKKQVEKVNGEAVRPWSSSREYKRKRYKELKAKGIRENAPRPKNFSRALMDIPTGTWVLYKTRIGFLSLVRIVGVLPSMVPFQEMDGWKLTRRASPSAQRVPRYLLAEKTSAVKDYRELSTAYAAELESNTVMRWEAGEEPDITRLAKPLPPGHPVQWETIGNKAKTTRNGKIVAYVPAGESLEELGYPHAVDECMGRHNRSQHDRYIVEADDEPGKNNRPYYLPTASKIEAPYITRIENGNNQGTLKAPTPACGGCTVDPLPAPEGTEVGPEGSR